MSKHHHNTGDGDAVISGVTAVIRLRDTVPECAKVCFIDFQALMWLDDVQHLITHIYVFKCETCIGTGGKIWTGSPSSLDQESALCWLMWWRKSSMFLKQVWQGKIRLLTHLFMMKATNGCSIYLWTISVCQSLSVLKHSCAIIADWWNQTSPLP